MYQQMIQEHLKTLGKPDYDPATVEAWMRLEHRTLDGLSAAQFRDEVRIGAECIDHAGPEESARLRVSMGL